MKRKFIKLLASCSLAFVIIIPIGTTKTIVNISHQSLIQTMGHGIGDG